MELDDYDKGLLQQAYAQLNASQAIIHFLANHFRDKYGLTPQNQITPDGRIITVPALDGATLIPQSQG